MTKSAYVGVVAVASSGDEPNVDWIRATPREVTFTGATLEVGTALILPDGAPLFVILGRDPHVSLVGRARGRVAGTLVHVAFSRCDAADHRVLRDLLGAAAR
ncbi:MAG TPA: hypothetical protein VF183_06620 [Acidimicrobiales bacterium]